MPQARLPEDVRYEIHLLVWSGYKNCEDIIDELLEMYEDDEDLDEEAVVAEVFAEFDRKCADEKSWQEPTDGERLGDLFEELANADLLAVECIGESTDEALQDMTEGFQDFSPEDRRDVAGYCFFTLESLRNALAGRGLTLNCGDLERNASKALAAARKVCDAAKQAGFEVLWDEKQPGTILLPAFKWQRPSALWGRSRLHQQITYITGQRDNQDHDYWVEFTHPQKPEGWIRISAKSIEAAYPFADAPQQKLQQLKVFIAPSTRIENFAANKSVTLSFPAEGYPIDDLVQFAITYLQRVWKITEPMSDLEWEDSDES